MIRLHEEEVELPPASTSLGALEFLHLLVLWIVCLLALLAAFLPQGRLGTGLAVGGAGLAAIALALARSLRLLLSDLFRQFQYREKFFLFLLHGVVAVLPILAGNFDWRLCLGGLLIFQCLIAVEPVFFARLYGGASLLFLVSCLINTVLPPAWLVGLFVSMLLLAIRLGSVRFVVEAHGEGYGPGLSRVLGHSAPHWMLPGGVAHGVMAMLEPQFQRRFLQLRMDPRLGPQLSVSITTWELLWRALVLVALLVGLLVALHYFDRLLRSRRKQAMEVGEVADGGVRRLRLVDPPENDLRPAADNSPRERIVRSFKAFAGSLGAFGLARTTGETAPDFLQRVHPLPEPTPEDARLFDEACYGIGPLTEEDATEFERLLEQRRSALRERAAERGFRPESG